jgi:hypothetical protein
MLRIGPQKIIDLIDRVLHSFSLRVHNSADDLIVMRTKKLERDDASPRGAAAPAA